VNSRHTTRHLRLLEVGVRWPPETFVGWKLEGLAARGIRVTVASRSIFDRDARLRDVELLELPQREGPRAEAGRVWLRTLALLFTVPCRMFRLLRAIRSLPPSYRKRYGGTTGLLSLYLPLARLRPDIVHFEWNSAAALYLPMFDVWRCPVVTSCHGSDMSIYPHVPGHEHYRARLPYVLRNASLVHCVSDSLRREAVALGLDPAKARVIRQGVDPELFRPANGLRARDRGAFRVIAIGHLRWMKGFEWALEATRAAVDRGVPIQLDIIGGDPGRDIGERSERGRILHTVADLGLDEHVRLLGFRPSAEVARRLQVSDALVLPSLDEGLPTVLLEAMACGLPFVATDCGGVSEAFTNGVEGFLVPPRDPNALAEALACLWFDPELGARMGEAGRATATSRFTLERQLDELVAMYRGAVGA
jgi:colanic acid/amylovoran biosynthesis glycosyltransferase